ncbi:MAG: DivIVA domain-containing protein [Dissulfuribacterales bacterium]
MAIAPNDILEKEFKTKLLGVDPDEVSAFLEEVAEELTQVIKERNALKAQLAQNTTKLEEYRAKEEDFKAVLTAAQKLSDELRKQAEKEAEILLEKARLEASRILNEAEKKGDRIAEENRRLLRIYRENLNKLRDQIQNFMRAIEEGAELKEELSHQLNSN